MPGYGFWGGTEAKWIWYSLGTSRGAVRGAGGPALSVTTGPVWLHHRSLSNWVAPFEVVLSEAAGNDAETTCNSAGSDAGHCGSESPS